MAATHINTRAWRRTEAGLLLSVRLTPKASSDRVDGLGTGANGPHLMARVRAVPDKGKANAALLEVIAAWLGVPKAAVRLHTGGKSRLKVVAVSGDQGALEARVQRLLNLPLP